MGKKGRAPWVSPRGDGRGETGEIEEEAYLNALLCEDGEGDEACGFAADENLQKGRGERQR